MIDELTIDEFIKLVDDADETDAPQQHPDVPPWKLLVVDDDEEVHNATRFVMRDLVILGRPLCLLHAGSAREAREQLQRHRDIAVAILDVVMETEQAGLKLVGYIRNELGLAECRIILRTGQPGYAPELTVINEYDINDYRTKAELTHTRLITMVSTALRAYEQFRAIEQNRRGLGLIVRATTDLIEQHTVSNLAEGVLAQLVALLKLPLDGIVCTHKSFPDGAGKRCCVVSAIGSYTAYTAQPLEALPDKRMISVILRSIAQGRHSFGEDYTVLYLKLSSQQDAAVFLDAGRALATLDHLLLEVFASNIAACFRNAKLVERLNHVAYHDPLTRLPNRLRFIADLDDIARERIDTVVALLDIEHFADFNDGLGQDMGNALLVAVTERLRTTLEPECRLARLGADMFGVIGPESIVNPTTLLALFRPSFLVDEHQLPVTVAIGFCRDLENASSGIALLKRANIALNRAKKSLHSHHEYYLAEMEDSTRWRLEITHQLRRAFDARQLQLWYQPQIALDTGRVVGMEALLRWPGERGFIQPPDIFIPLAEYSGLIVQIGAWVLAQACAQHAKLGQLGFAHLKMAVNVSMPQFRKADFVENMATILAHYQMPPQMLELEITESIAMDEPKVMLQRLDALRQLGILIAIDDFGTGYSSLSQLRSLPIDCLKIDKSFVQKIHNGKGGLFAETIMDLSKKLRVTSVAEGVETLEQVDFLRGLGCAVAQGYLYARPMPADQLVAWLQSRNDPDHGS